MKRLLICLLAILLPSQAFGQGSVLQGGSWTPGILPMYSLSGGSQPTIQQSATAAGGAQSIKELSVVARGSGTAPFVGSGGGYLGSTFCLYDAPPTNATGGHQLCLGSNVTGGFGLLSYNAFGSATSQVFKMVLNGTTYEFPFASSGIVGPGTTVVNDLVCWNNTSGTLVKDCGTLAFSNITGQVTLAQLPTLATHTILANATSGSATPTAVTLDASLQFTGGTLALNPGNANTWTALQTWSGGGITLGGNAGGAPPFTATAATQWLGADSKTWGLVNATAASATVPEVGFQSVITSAVGGGNPTTAFKIAMFAGCKALSGSADCYTFNAVGQLNAGVSSAIEALVIEADLNVYNAHYGDATGSPTQPYATPFYLAAGGDHRASAMMMVNCGVNPTNCANRGLVFWNGTFRLNTIEDYMTAQSVLFGAGTYSSAAIDFSAATISLAGMRLPNNVPALSWRNAANSGNLSPIVVNSSDILAFGAANLAGFQFLGDNDGNSLIYILNSHATSGDIGLTIGVGSTANTDVSLLMTFYNYALNHNVGSIARVSGGYTVAYNTSSDLRLKQEIEDVSGSLDRLMRVRPRSYRWIGDESGHRDNGFIAQELQDVYPAAVRVGGIDPHKEPWQVDYGRLTPLLAGAIQDAKHEIDSLAARVSALERAGAR